MGHLEVFDVVRVGLWLVAGAVALFFSVGSARIWTSISTGFFLVFLSEGYLIAPWVRHPSLMALHSVAGTVAALVITYGFMEYYVFARTLEAPGAKWKVYAGVAAVLAASVVFIFINPTPSGEVVHRIRLVENTCWTFLVVINLDLLRKIHREVRDTPIGSGFAAFGLVFAFVFLWRGSMLFLQVYGWDEGGGSAADYPFRVGLATEVNRFASMLSSVAMGGTFIHLARALR